MFHLNAIYTKRQLLSTSSSLFNFAPFCSLVCCRNNALSSLSFFRMTTEPSPDICLFKPLLSDVLLYPIYELPTSFPFLVIVTLALETAILWIFSPTCCSRSSKAVRSFRSAPSIPLSHLSPAQTRLRGCVLFSKSDDTSHKSVPSHKI